jgi:hypothetical protein
MGLGEGVLIVELVRMKNNGECGPACLATVLGISLDEAIAEVEAISGNPVRTHGSGDDEIIAVLDKHGFKAEHGIDWPFVGEGRVPAIVTVPSLNVRGLLHYIVWDGEVFLDPACGEFYYPDDAPIVRGYPQVFWASVITWERKSS